jgi:hypothetical protein
MAALASLGLAVVALLLALIQLGQAHRQTKSLNRQGEALLFVTSSLSTRYLGAFPEYLTHVARLVGNTTSELRVLVGNPLPAYFSSPARFLAYAQAIERVSLAGVSVRMICMDHRRREERLRLQFPTSQAAWDAWLPINRSKVEAFLRYRYPDEDVTSLSHIRLLELLSETQRELLHQLFVRRSIDVREVDHLVAVQLWLADNKEAIFSIQTSSRDAMSYGLFTSDPHFVNALTSMFHLYEQSV